MQNIYTLTRATTLFAILCTTIYFCNLNGGINEHWKEEKKIIRIIKSQSARIKKKTRIRLESILNELISSTIWSKRNCKFKKKLLYRRKKEKFI